MSSYSKSVVGNSTITGYTHRLMEAFSISLFHRMNTEQLFQCSRTNQPHIIRGLPKSANLTVKLAGMPWTQLFLISAFRREDTIPNLTSFQSELENGRRGLESSFPQHQRSLFDNRSMSRNLRICAWCPFAPCPFSQYVPACLHPASFIVSLGYLFQSN